MNDVEEHAKSPSLQRLEMGEISLDDYLDDRTEMALKAYLGKVPASTIENMRFILREKIRTDPVLVEVVRRITGTTPTALSGSGTH